MSESTRHREVCNILHFYVVNMEELNGAIHSQDQNLLSRIRNYYVNDTDNSVLLTAIINGDSYASNFQSNKNQAFHRLCQLLGSTTKLKLKSFTDINWVQEVNMKLGILGFDEHFRFPDYQDNRIKPYRSYKAKTLYPLINQFSNYDVRIYGEEVLKGMRIKGKELLDSRPPKGVLTDSISELIHVICSPNAMFGIPESNLELERRMKRAKRVQKFLKKLSLGNIGKRKKIQPKWDVIPPEVYTLIINFLSVPDIFCVANTGGRSILTSQARYHLENRRTNMAIVCIYDPTLQE